MALACTAPPGSWCNGTVVIALWTRSDPKPTSSAAALRALAAGEVGGCCCSLCEAACASSPVYSCESCTGAATRGCAACYFTARSYHGTYGDCWESPPSPPWLPPLPPHPLLPPALPLVAATRSSPSAPPAPPSVPVQSKRDTGDHAPLPSDSTQSKASLPTFVLALTCVVGLTWLLRVVACYRYRSRYRRRQVRQPATEPTTVVEIEALATRTVQKPLASEGDNELPECAICISAFAPGESVAQLPCGHEFHATCISTWLATTSNPVRLCPLCKKPACSPCRPSSDPPARTA